jgi:hypothetical protein
MANILLENRTTDGSGNSVSVASGGYRIIRFRGTFDGATVVVDADLGDSNFVPADDTGRTTEGLLYLALTQGMSIRATVSNAGASTDITVDFL